MSYLKLENIKKAYRLPGGDNFPVLKGINLDFDKGDFVSILGESGGGKSTLMNIIAGLDHSYSGDVILDGKSTKDYNEKQMDQYRRETIGFIFQSFNLINYQTNLQNVLTSLEMTDLTNSQKKQRATELLKKVGLEKHINKYPNQLSGGQKQRVAVARALASDPQIIIADEPTGALDSKTTKEILELLNQIAKEGKLVITVTHSQEVADSGTRIIHLADGKIDGDKRLKKGYLSTSKSKTAKSKTTKSKSTANTKQLVTTADGQIGSKPLSRSTLWSMAFSHLRFNKLRNFLIMLGTAIGIFSVILFLGLGNGISGYINNQVTSLVNPNVIYAVQADPNKNDDPEATTELAQQAFMNPDLQSNQATIDQIKDTSNHVKSAELYFTFATGFQVTIDGQDFTGTQIANYNPSINRETKDNSALSEGKMPSGNQVVIDQSIAKEWNNDDYKSLIGKEVTIAVQINGQPISFTATVSGIGSQEQSQVNLFTTDQFKQVLSDNGLPVQAPMVAVEVDDTENVKSVEEKLEKTQINGTNNEFAVMTVGSALDTVNTFTLVSSRVLAMIAGISLLVSALMIVVTTYMSVSERTKEIGVLRALGGRSGDIRKLFTNESLMIGVFGAIIGLVLALLVQLAVNKGLWSMTNYNIVQISIWNIIFAIIISIIIALLAAFLPSRKAANLDPIETLASE